MKSSVIRGLMMFVAGAGCATVVAGIFENTPPITVGQFLERANKVNVEVELLGRYVGLAEDGRVGIYTSPDACVIPPPPPIIPVNAVDSRSFRHGVAALGAVNEAHMLGLEEPVFEIGKCRVK